MTAATTLLGVMLIAFLIAVAVVAWTWDLAWVFSIALATSIFAQWPDFFVAPLPASVDRIVLLIAFAALVARRHETAIGTLRPATAHWLLVLASAYVVLSAAWAGTLADRDGVFRLLDAYGFVPFAMFVVAPYVFPQEPQRQILLRTLTLVGAYLSATALFETLDLDRLVVPPYILDPDVGLHSERARGPFVEAVANGLALFVCGVAACMVAASSRTTRGRIVASTVALLASVALFLTLTRAIWLGSVLAAFGPLLLSARLRRYAVVAVPVILVAGLTLVATVPDLRERVTRRQADQSPIWDRINLNSAAARMIGERPLVGFGWYRFTLESEPYLRQSDTIPLSGRGVDLHNVFLVRLVELGVLGAALWGAAFVVAIVAPIRSRAPSLPQAWRIGLAAIAIQWIVVANFGPLPYVFPNLLLWTWAGIVYHSHVAAAVPRGAAAVSRYRLGTA